MPRLPLRAYEGFAVFASLAISACAGDGLSGKKDDSDQLAQQAAVSPATDSKAITYQGDIRAILETSCVECHKPGGMGPMRLDDWDTVKKYGASIVSAALGGRMPPWPASDSCQPIAESRALSQDAKDKLKAWQTGGYQAGDAADYKAPTGDRRVDLGTADLHMPALESFTPPAKTDDYRCFYLGDLKEDTYLTALDIIPGDRSEVHHAQLHRVEASYVAAVQKLDADSAGGGYPCSSSGVSGGASNFVPSQNMFSYRPGSVAVVLPPGDAVYLKGGSGLVLQIHYNTQFLPAGQSPTPDTSRVEIWKFNGEQKPKRVIWRTGLFSPLSGTADGTTAQIFNSVIPANQSHVVGQANVPMGVVSKVNSGYVGYDVGPVSSYIQGEIVGITPHAHSWATRMYATIQPRGASAAQCLLEIPKWDYQWQLDYLFKDGVPYQPLDTLHVECTYDNTANNQPIVNGQRIAPGPINFGENTTNEMCLHYFWLRTSYENFTSATYTQGKDTPVFTLPGNEQSAASTSSTPALGGG